MKKIAAFLIALTLSNPVLASYLGDPVNIKSGGTGLATLPSAGQMLIGNAGGTAYALALMSGEATMTSLGVVTLTNSAVIGKVLTGYVSGAGTVAATDTILQAIQKLNGNIATTVSGINQLTGDVTAGPGTGSQAATLATVNGNVGSFTNANITVNAKGLITAAANGSGGTTSALSKAINQTAHGFAVQDVIYYTGSAWAKAKADSATTSEVLGVVSVVTDANNFTVVPIGFVSGLSGLTAGTTYFLSDATAGLLTATEPTTSGSVSKPVLVADSTTSGYVVQSRGAIIGTSGSSTMTSQILVSGGNGFGSTNTAIRRFTTTVTSTGTDITYADSATLGNTFTINSPGVYCLQYSDSKSSGTANHGASVNSAQLTTAINAITNANLLMQISVDGSIGVQGVVSYCGIFAATDVIRAHTDGTQNTSGNPVVRFKITKVGN